MPSETHADAGRRVGQGTRATEDLVLSGPLPVDPNDPQWTWLEAAASAWLARRGSNAANDEAFAEPVPTLNGTDGVATRNG
jgi:hypothetical protein